MRWIKGLLLIVVFFFVFFLGTTQVRADYCAASVKLDHYGRGGPELTAYGWECPAKVHYLRSNHIYNCGTNPCQTPGGACTSNDDDAPCKYIDTGVLGICVPESTCSPATCWVGGGDGGDGGEVPPIPCDSSPSAPTLLSPPNGATIYSGWTGLTQSGGYGGNCGVVGYDVIDIWDSSWNILMEAVVGGMSYGGGGSGTYYWNVSTHNSSGQMAYGQYRSFNLVPCNPDAWGTCPVSCGGGTQYNGCGTP